MRDLTTECPGDLLLEASCLLNTAMDATRAPDFGAEDQAGLEGFRYLLLHLGALVDSARQRMICLAEERSIKAAALLQA